MLLCAREGEVTVEATSEGTHRERERERFFAVGDGVEEKSTRT
jgi:hypothetical protein